MKKQLCLAIFCAAALLAGCGKKSVQSTGASGTPAAQSQAQAASASEWKQAAARKFEQADTGVKHPFVCKVALNTSSYMDEAVPHGGFGGGNPNLPTTITGDSSIGFDLVNPSELRVSATSPNKAAALIATAGSSLITAAACYSDVANPPSSTEAAASATYHGDLGPYLWAQYALRLPGKMSTEAIAKALSPAYAAQTDVFKLQDMLKQLQPKVNDMMATAKAKPYMDQFVSMSFAHYDQQTNTFDVNANSMSFSPASAISEMGAGWSGGIALSPNGSAAMLAPHPANIQVAKAFEAFISRGNMITANMHFKCVGVGAIGLIPTVEVWLVRYDIVDSHGKVLFTVGPKGTLRTA